MLRGNSPGVRDPLSPARRTELSPASAANQLRRPVRVGGGDRRQDWTFHCWSAVGESRQHAAQPHQWTGLRATRESRCYGGLGPLSGTAPGASDRGRGTAVLFAEVKGSFSPPASSCGDVMLPSTGLLKRYTCLP